MESRLLDAGRVTIRFDIHSNEVVDSALSGEAEIRLPVRRVQVVSFPEGEMRVLGQYNPFELTGGD